MDSVVVAAGITIIPAAITATFIGLRRLKRIGHAVNGRMDERFQRIEDGLHEIHAEIREMKADARAVKVELRDYRSHLLGDGR